MSADSMVPEEIKQIVEPLINRYTGELFAGKSCGASPGKLILSMRVVKEDGLPFNMGAALTRGLWRFIDSIVFGLVAYVTMTKPLQQRLGDKRAHTVVISKNDMLPGSSRDWPMFVIALAFFVAVQLLVILINLLTTITFVSVNGFST
jgi:hypothetical protein